MERRKYQKKAGLYFILFMVAAAFLTGCKRRLRSDNYSEWVDAIGINEYPHVSCGSYYLYANGLRLTIENFDFESADEFKQIIDNHNEFVTRNPDYFPEDFDINISFETPSGYDPLRFSNRTDSDIDKGWVDYIELSEMETEKSHRMRYVYVFDFYLLNRINTKFEAETIIIDYDQYGTYATDMSEYFTGFKRIIVDVGSDVEETRVMNFLKQIWQATPDVEIYYEHYPKKMTKYKPDENSK